MNTKTIQDYKIDKLRKEELTRICWQYKSMKRQVHDLITASQDGISISQGRNKVARISDPVASAAARRERLMTRINAIETCAKLAGRDCAKGLLIGVTTQGSRFETLHMRGQLYCGRRQYYEMKSKFYYLLDSFLP